MKEEKFPHTRKPLHWERQGVVSGGSLGATEESTATGAEGKVERFPHRSVPTSTHSPRGLSAHPLGRVGAGS